VGAAQTAAPLPFARSAKQPQPPKMPGILEDAESETDAGGHSNHPPSAPAGGADVTGAAATTQPAAHTDSHAGLALTLASTPSADSVPPSSSVPRPAKFALSVPADCNFNVPKLEEIYKACGFKDVFALTPEEEQEMQQSRNENNVWLSRWTAMMRAYGALCMSPCQPVNLLLYSSTA
jgi:hypothetical protein